MNIKLISGSIVTAIVLFIFGFIYWAINPLPYQSWNQVEDPVSAQKLAAELFPESGLYFLPGPGNDPEAVKLLETGPAVFLTIDHSPVAGPDPAALAIGFFHNIVTVLLLSLLLSKATTLGSRLQLAGLVAVLAIVVINGSEFVWWMQPVSWIVHQAVYYLAYFLIATCILHRFLPTKAA